MVGCKQLMSSCHFSFVWSCRPSPTSCSTKNRCVKVVPHSAEVSQFLRDNPDTIRTMRVAAVFCILVSDRRVVGIGCYSEQSYLRRWCSTHSCELPLIRTFAFVRWSKTLYSALLDQCSPRNCHATGDIMREKQDGDSPRQIVSRWQTGTSSDRPIPIRVIKVR